ncbi:HDOD domain-containing protein [Thiomicrorhabdus indica]|uniref:HDOD domain-containing protein n=1 Tax=Thiomicrorhabdus indica TaxID=2267253 RepID=UPI00102D845F|nr:HDOD domain-containing protein [Thiomicrorhabdus indica]
MAENLTQQEKVQESVYILSTVKFPAVPTGVIWLEEKLRNDNVNFFDVIRELENHSGIVEEIIKTANQVLHNLNNPVSNISQAINFLGTQSLYHLVISAHFKELFSQNEVYAAVLEHSIWTAKAMVLIERRCGDYEPDFAYSMGLFHNLGAMAMSIYDPAKYEELFQKSRAFPVSALEKEEKRYGTNHCLLGVIIGKKWKLPRLVLEGIYRHHQLDIEAITDKEIRKWVSRLRLANELVDQVCYEIYQTTEMKQAQQIALEELKLNNQHFQSFKNDLAQNFLKSQY